MDSTTTDIRSISAYGPARSSVSGSPLEPQELQRMQRYWNATLYLSAGMIYLRDNPLLREPLKPEHVKRRLLGHWGSDPGMSLVYIHLNRLIKKYDLDVIFLAGPGHGAPALISNVYLEGAYSEIYSEVSEDADGMRRLFKQFSFPGGIGSHCTPETPGSIHEGGELGYSVSHAYGAVFDNPDLIAMVMVGDGEAETGPLATAWHSNKFLNPARDGAVLPVLHLNGYKIANPTILSRISHEELESLFVGYGYDPYFVEGSDPDTMHQAMAATLDHCVQEIRRIQQEARANPSGVKRPRWPMIVLRSPKGWTGPSEVDGHKVEGFWRSHQVPLAGMHEKPAHLKQLEEWLRSYRPEELFDEGGRLVPELRALAPEGRRRMGANPHANGGLLRKALSLPEFHAYAVETRQPGRIEVSPTQVARPVPARCRRRNCKTSACSARMKMPPTGWPQSTRSPRRLWLGEYLPEDADGGELAPDGRVMEMLSEHTLEGWLEGYLLTGRHGFFSTYEAFVHVIDSMFNQHAKWLDNCSELSWRADIASLNLLITSTVWRQDHNGFTHQDPGLPGCRREQEPGGDAHLPAAGRELPAVGRGSLPAEPQLRQRDRRGQAAAPVLSRHGRGREALRQGRRHLAVGEQRRGYRARRRDGELRRHRDDGSSGGHRHAAGTFSRAEGAVRQRRRPVPAGAGHRASAWFLRP